MKRFLLKKKWPILGVLFFLASSTMATAQFVRNLGVFLDQFEPDELPRATNIAPFDLIVETPGIFTLENYTNIPNGIEQTFQSVFPGIHLLREGGARKYEQLVKVVVHNSKTTFLTSKWTSFVDMEVFLDGPDGQLSKRFTKEDKRLNYLGTMTGQNLYEDTYKSVLIQLIQFIIENLSSSGNTPEPVEDKPVPEEAEEPILTEKGEEAVVVSEVDQNIPDLGKVREDRFALIIGNEHYSTPQTGLNPEVNVDFALNDARIFKQYALKTLGIPEDQIIYLEDAGTVAMNRAINQFCALMKVAGSESEFFFYYAGHGFPDQDTQVPYLIPVDVGGTDLSFAIALPEIYRRFNEHPIKRLTLFLDACFSGGARNEGLLADRGVRIKPKPSELPVQAVLFSATSATEPATALKDQQHGVFTYFLLKKLQESKGKLSYAELSEYLVKEVAISAILSNNREQIPTVQIGAALQEDWEELRF